MIATSPLTTMAAPAHATNTLNQDVPDVAIDPASIQGAGVAEKKRRTPKEVKRDALTKAQAKLAELEGDVIKKLAEIAATRIGSTKAKREAVLQVKQTEVAEQQAKVMACQKEFDALVEKEALKVQASVCPSCRSTFGHHILGVPDRTLPRIGSPPIARGCASPRRPVYFPPLSRPLTTTWWARERFFPPPLAPQVPSSSPPWPRSTTTSI